MPQAAAQVNGVTMRTRAPRFAVFNGLTQIDGKPAVVTARRAKRGGRHLLTVAVGDSAKTFGITPRRRGRGRFSSALLGLAVRLFLTWKRKAVRA
jgi:hypothetical protein